MSSVATPIAICGMGMRLPGGIRDADSFWKFLCNKSSGRCRIPKDRYDVGNFHGPSKIGHVASEYGYFIDDINLGHADASFWSMTKEEIATMDPQQRLALEVTYEALQTAGQPPEALSSRRVGVYVGTFEGDWQEINRMDTQNHHMYQMTGCGDYMPANRISREFGFTGPSVTVRTACSSSLTALHDACRALCADECEAAVVAGANIIISPGTTVIMKEQGIMSSTGFCNTFDATANGYVRGEAVSALYIKRLSDAIRDGDPVRSIIRSTAVNACGRSSSITTPSREAIEALIGRAHVLAGVPTLARTAMIECHGTGTAVGDPIEAQAIANLFGSWGIRIGSVKPNLGHSEGASGLTSIIKMTLALENRTIPPNINFRTPNPKIPFDECKLMVPTEPEPWPVDRDELVVVNSFGVAGSNAVAMLSSARDGESYRLCPHARHKDYTEPEASSTTRLLLFSARHPDALRRSMQDHESYLISHPDSLRDMSFSLAAKRDHMPYRAFCVTNGLEDLVPTLALRPVLQNKKPPEFVFVFTGQGAQWAGMGQSLMRNAPEYQEALQSLDTFLHTLPDGPSWSLIDELRATGKKSRLSEAEVSQPCCTAVQVALVILLSRRYGIRPGVVVGHSSGEIAGAFAAGLITANEAMLLAYYRGRAVAQLASTPQRGTMAAIGLGSATITPYLLPGVVVGCENSPVSTTITGDLAAVQKVIQAVKKEHPDAQVRELNVDSAYHSFHMEPVAAVYHDFIEGKFSPVDASIPFISSVTGEIISEGAKVGPQYWVRNLVSPVRFSTAIAKIVETWSTRKIFMELGPHSALAAPVRQSLQRLEACDDEYIGTLRRGNDSGVDILKMVGTLWLHGCSLEYGDIMEPGRFLPDLPLYPWHYEKSFWSESRLSREYRLRRFPHHDLLGSRVKETSDESPAWRNILRTDYVDWTLDYGTKPNIIFPATGYVCMAGEAVRQVTDAGLHDFSVRKVHMEKPLSIHSGHQIELVTQLWRTAADQSTDSCWYEFFVSSVDPSGNWVKHATGQVRSGSDFSPSPISVDIGELPRRVLSKEWYGGLRSRGLRYGQRFARLADMSAHTTERRAIANTLNDIRHGESTYAIHPTTIDCLIQTLSVAYVNGLKKRLGPATVPTYIGDMFVRQIATEARIDIATNWETDPYSRTVSNTVSAHCDGEIVARVRDVRLSSLQMDDAGPEAEKALDLHVAAAMIWKEDLALLDDSSLMRVGEDRTNLHRVLDLFASACIVEASQQTRDLRPSCAHLQQYATWMHSLSEEICQGMYCGVSDTDLRTILNDSERRSILQDLRPVLEKSVAAPAAEAVWRVTSHCCEILTAQTDVLELLFEGGVMHQLYNFMSNLDCSRFIKLLSHGKPGLNILEIGAGTGGTTATILPALHSQETGQRMYGSYVYTDVSSGFFHTARERFKDFPGMNFAVLDISKDPGIQGFDLESFDLVIACNVLHATPSLKETLENVRKLIRPDGRLLLQELSPVTKWINFVAGVLPGWWLGSCDSRPVEPYVSAERWDTELRSAGFDGIQSMEYDGYLNNNMIILPAATIHQPKRITLLLRGSRSRRAGPDRIMERHLAQSGYHIERYYLEDSPTKDLPADQDVVSALDLTSSLFQDLDDKLFRAWQQFVVRLRDTGRGLLWPTRTCAYAVDASPEYGMVLGISRLLGAETNIDFATVEIDHVEESSLGCMPKVLDSFQRQRQIKAAASRLTLEWRVVGGSVFIGRYYPVNVTQELRAAPEASTPRKLVRCRTGMSERFYWAGANLPPLDPDQVEIAVKAIGTDCNEPGQLLTSSIAKNEASITDKFVCEASGIITKVGLRISPEVLGQRVAVCTSGHLATTLRVPAEFCLKIANSLTFEQAALMPAAYCNAIHCLIDRVRIQAGMSILIHTMPSGISFAAIQIARMIGCKIYCAVSSEEEARYLTKTLNIPRAHVLNCQDSSFVAEILAEETTKGLGVDVVLTSFEGELLRASSQCVAEYGTLVHIRTRDLTDQENPAVELPQANMSFVSLNLRHTIHQRPEIVASLMQRMMNFYERGFIGLLSHRQAIEAVEISDHLCSLGKAADLAAVMTLMPDNPQELPTEPAAKALRMRSDRAYLLVGDLGICGRAIATWLVERGAQHIVFLFSSGKSGIHEAFELELASMGCTSIWVSGDGARDADVVHAIRSAEIPFAGVFQTTAAPKAAKKFKDLCWEEWDGARRIKTECTWNLHRVLQREQQEPLDIFMLFSSAGSIVGESHLGGAAAADAFLNAFVSYRHSLGLVASCLNVDFAEDGLLHNELELLDCVELMAMPHAQRTQLVMGPWAEVTAASPSVYQAWHSDPRFLPLRILADTNTSGASALSSSVPSPDIELHQFLEGLHSSTALLKSDYASELLGREVGRALLGLMARPQEDVDINAPLTTLGMDSLVGLEMRDWIRQKLRVDLAVQDIVEAGSVKQLGAAVQKKIGERIGIESTGGSRS